MNPVADLALTKSDSPDPVLAGGTLTYNLTVQNNGPSTGDRRDRHRQPAGQASPTQSATPSQGTCSQASGTVTCSLGAIANGGSATVADHRHAASRGTITNTASVQPTADRPW